MRELDPESCRLLIDKYNQDSYRGRRNVELDRAGYRMFESASGRSDLAMLAEFVRFAGEDYGGAQARFLDGGYVPESERIARAMHPSFGEYFALARAQPPLTERVPTRETLARLAAPFDASKFWIVWASKFLHFLAPDTFPILDSRAEAALGLRRGSDPVRYYEDFSMRIRDVLVRNCGVLQQLCEHDVERAPVLKVLDKVLYEEGAPSRAAASVSASQQIPSHSVALQAAVPPAADPATLVEGPLIQSWITNIASHAERARSGDRFELCIGKTHAVFFPEHKQEFVLVVQGAPWRVRIGKRHGVQHLYVLTECTAPDRAPTKITALLRSAGLRPGDRPMLRHAGPHRFELIPPARGGQVTSSTA